MKFLALLRWTSLLLTLPAVALCAGGLLHSGPGWSAANDVLDRLQAFAWTRPLFSPWVVLGGPLLLVATHAPAIVRLSADAVNEYWVVALSVKRIARHVVPLLIGGALLALLLCYAFTENFRIVPR